MQRVKYIYNSTTKKLTASGRDAVIVQGDGDSTRFEFVFPEVYNAKDDGNNVYVKEIAWDCNAYDEDKKEIWNPHWLLDETDSFVVPYNLTSANPGKQISFSIKISKRNTDYLEVSLPTAVYITRTTKDKIDIKSNDLLTLLTKRAFVDAHFSVAEVPGIEGVTQLQIEFESLSGVPRTIYLDKIPYLDDNNKIAKKFISTDQIVTIRKIATADLLTECDWAVSPDMVYAEDSGTIYVLYDNDGEIKDAYKDKANWIPSTSITIKDIENRIQESEDKITEAYTAADRIIKAGYEEADAALRADIDKNTEEITKTNAALEKKVDKVEGSSLVPDTEIAKLATVKENAEPNKIDSISIGTEVLTISDKNVDISPVKLKLDQNDDKITLDGEELNKATNERVGLVPKGTLGRIDALEEGSGNLSGEISALKTKVETNATNITQISESVTALSAKVDTNTQNITEASGEINTLKQDVTTVSDKVTALEPRVTALETKVESKQNKLTIGDAIDITGDVIKVKYDSTLKLVDGNLATNVGIGDVADLQTKLDEKASVTYVDTELAKKQNILTFTNGVTEAGNNVSVDYTKVQKILKEGSNITISDDGTISASGELASASWKNLEGNPTESAILVSESILSWKDTITYKINDMVKYEGKIYTSLQADNVNHIPSESGDFWRVTEGSGSGSSPAFVKLVGDGTSSTISIKHNLGTKNLFVTVRDATDGTFVDALVKAVDDNTIQIIFNTAPAKDSVYAIISGGATGGSGGGTGGSGWEGVTWNTTTEQNEWVINLADYNGITFPDRDLVIQTYDTTKTEIVGSIIQDRANKKIYIRFNNAVAGTAILI